MSTTCPHIVGFERFRAGQFGIRHYCTIGLNSKEANNEELAEGVMEILPRFALKEGVVAIGEIGYDEQTALEDKYFRAQLELAKELDLPVMIHTPHRDKKRGTTRSMDVCEEHGLDPSKVIVDHNNEETVAEVLQRGFWAAFSIYPSHQDGRTRGWWSFCSKYGAERIIVDSACDWGISDAARRAEDREAGAASAACPSAMCALACYGNALAAYGQSGQMQESDWLDPPADRPAHALRGQFRPARRPRTAHRAARRWRMRRVLVPGQ